MLSRCTTTRVVDDNAHQIWVKSSSSAAAAVDCVMSDWADSGACSATCGGGTMTQTRTVVTEASNGGTACPTSLSQTKACNTQDCPTSSSGGTCDTYTYVTDCTSRTYE